MGVRDIAFLGTDGKPVQARQSGSGSSGSLHQTYYQLASKLETCTLRMTVPEKVETATVAISLTTGLGFSPAVRRSFVPTPNPERPPGDAP